MAGGCRCAARRHWRLGGGKKSCDRAPHPYRKADAEYFITLQGEQGAAHPVFALVAVGLADQPIIGGMGFGRARGAAALDTAELGYWIARDHWRQGYAFEAASAVLDLAFWGLHVPQMTASHSIDNPISGALLAKLGFVETGSGEVWSEARQEVMQVRTLALERENWEAKRTAAQKLAA